MAETVMAAPAENNDEIWEFLNRISRPVGGGSDDDIWEDLGVQEEERVGWGERFWGAVEGVGEWLVKLPGLRHYDQWVDRLTGNIAAPRAAEPEEAVRNRFFGWIGDIGRRFNEWLNRPILEIGVLTVSEGEADRFGWLKNTWEWLKGAPGGLVNKFRRRGETVAAPQISRAERVKALKEGTGHFLKEWGPEIAVGLLGGYFGYSTFSPESIQQVGVLKSAALELGATILAGITAGLYTIGDERGPEAIPEYEGRFGRVAAALRKACSQKVVRRALKLTAAGSGGFAVGGIGRMVVDILQGVQQSAAAPTATPAPTEVGSATDIANAIGDTRREAIEAAQQGAQLARQHAAEIAQQIADTVSQSTDALAQANTIVAGISPDVVGDPSVQGAAEQARQAIEAFNQFNASAAAGGIDAGEAAHLQQLATDAMNAARQAADTANQVVQQIADAAATQVAATQAAEAARQVILQNGAVMKDVIAATPSQTVFEALIQQAFQATGSPYSTEAANALSWTLPKGDILVSHQGAISEGAKKVVELLQQAHDFAAAHGGEYTVHAIRQAVNDNQLPQDVLQAVEAANLPAGEGKTQAIQALNTVLQSVIK